MGKRKILFQGEFFFLFFWNLGWKLAEVTHAFTTRTIFKNSSALLEKILHFFHLLWRAEILKLRMHLSRPYCKCYKRKTRTRSESTVNQASISFLFAKLSCSKMQINPQKI